MTGRVVLPEAEHRGYSLLGICKDLETRESSNQIAKSISEHLEMMKAINHYGIN